MLSVTFSVRGRNTPVIVFAYLLLLYSNPYPPSILPIPRETFTSSVSFFGYLHKRCAIMYPYLLKFSDGEIRLLLCVWGRKQSGLLVDLNKEMTDVHKCMETLKASKRSCRSGKLWFVFLVFRK